MNCAYCKRHSEQLVPDFIVSEPSFGHYAECYYSSMNRIKVCPDCYYWLASCNHSYIIWSYRLAHSLITKAYPSNYNSQIVNTILKQVGDYYDRQVTLKEELIATVRNKLFRTGIIGDED